MSISVKTRKMLWGKAANRCAFINCKREFVMDETETDDPSIIGEECHIIAREDDGPRGDADFPKTKRDLFNNLILMCNIHHKLIDDQEIYYSVEKLKKMKSDHENWVNSSLTIDEKRIKEDLLYSSYIDHWVKVADLDNWDAWTSWLFGSGQPTIKKERFSELAELRRWMFSRVMPNTLMELENSFENFRRVLDDFIITFNVHLTDRGDEIEIKKFYKIDDWNPELHNKLHKEYMFHVDLIMDLTVELTRAANYLCEQIRKYILSDFRLKEGLLVITTGPYMDLTYRKYRVVYKRGLSSGIPYEGLNEFKKERENRDFFFGVGANVEEAEKLGTIY